MFLEEKENEEESKYRLIVFGFDIIELNGQKLLETPLSERRSKIPITESIKLSECKEFSYPKEKSELLNYFLKAIEEKNEGLIIKGSSDFYYTNGTRRHWGKLKKGCRV